MTPARVTPHTLPLESTLTYVEPTGDISRGRKYLVNFSVVGSNLVNSPSGEFVTQSFPSPSKLIPCVPTVDCLLLAGPVRLSSLAALAPPDPRLSSFQSVTFPVLISTLPSVRSGLP